MESRTLQCQFLSADMSGVSLINRSVPDPGPRELLIRVRARKNVDNFGENLMGTPEAEALNDIAECGNGRSYTTVRVKEAK